MTYNIIETHGVGLNRRTKTIAGADSLADAIALAHNIFTIIDLERDPLNQHCADFFTSCGRVMQIEPWA
jgi:hypothetical protein